MNYLRELLNFIICLCMANLGGSIVFLPNLFEKTPTAFKVVCHSKASLTNGPPANLFCKDDAKIKIFDSVSGKQDKELCFHLTDTPFEEEPCNEVTETTRVLKEKCDSRSLCAIDLKEPFPCSDHTYSYLNISYSCVPKNVPYKSFAQARFGSSKRVRNKRPDNQPRFKTHQPKAKKQQNIQSLFKLHNNFRINH